MFEDLFNVDNLLNTAFPKKGLMELFEKKLDDLKIYKTNVQDILGIPYRSLKGILEGTQKSVDVTYLIKLADFLKMPKEEVFKLYVESIQKKHSIYSTSSPEKIKFIKDNFDLLVLKHAGLIDTISDFKHIEDRITARLGYKSIFEYKKPTIDIAFSSGLFQPKNLLTRLFWIRTAICTFEEINNANEYDRQALIKYFPQIRWYTMNEERGLSEVIKSLYQLGITVIFQAPLQGLQLRGATFSVNDQPCIVLTNYQGFYSTLWFCLLHELYHVLFDWNEIKNDCYHLTDDDNDELTVQEREKEADNFARDYLFSKEKLLDIKPYLKNISYIKEIAESNHVHYSIIYAFSAFDSKNDRMAWARAKKNSPDISYTIKNIEYPWNDEKHFEEVIREQKQLIYNQ